MSTLLRILAPFLLRMLRRFGPSIPGINHEAIARNMRKLRATLAWATLALVSLLGGILTLTIDAAVQYERHAQVEFNVVMQLALGALGLAIVSAFAARAQMPRLNDLLDVAHRRPGGRAAELKSKSQSRRPEYAR